MHTMFRAALAAGLFTLATAASADVTYRWVCASPDCGADAGFSMTMTFSDAAVAAGGFTGGFTGANGNIVDVKITSAVGGGYTNTLADLVNSDPASLDNDRDDISVIFSDDRSVVDALYDFGDGLYLWFASVLGETSFREGMSRDYFVFRRSSGVESTTDSIRGMLVRDDSMRLPEPASLSLVGLALMGLAVLRRRKA